MSGKFLNLTIMGKMSRANVQKVIEYSPEVPENLRSVWDDVWNIFEPESYGKNN
ncbi:MAG: hypothetical protein WBA93_08000 [Microcoleaceae cyanobacterium]